MNEQGASDAPFKGVVHAEEGMEAGQKLRVEGDRFYLVDTDASKGVAYLFCASYRLCFH